MKSLAIIGSNGMLGSDLVRFLSDKFFLTPINKENYSKHLGQSFDVVVNANGNSKRYWANQYPLEDFIVSTVSVYQSLFDFKSKQYIYISSSDVYENHTLPRYTKEDQEVNSNNLSPYGFHKYLSETLIKRFVKNYLILRCSMILGSNLKKGPFYDIWHHQPLFITRTSKLQLITSKEIANLIYFFVNQRIHRQTFNLGGAGTFSFVDIQKYFKQPVIFKRAAEKQVYEMNVNKLQKLYPLKTSQEYLQQFLQGLQLHN